MPKRSSSNYSLWPEQARPRRGISMTLAAGGFAVGIVCAIAAHNVLSDIMRPTAVQEASRFTAGDDHTPVYATPTHPPVLARAAAPDPVRAAAPDTAAATDADAVNRNRNRSRPAAIKPTLPAIGTQTAATTSGSETVGRAASGRSGDEASPVEMRFGALSGPAREDTQSIRKTQPPAKAPEQAKPELQAPVLARAAEETSTERHASAVAGNPEETKPATNVEQRERRAQRAQKARKKVVRERRERREREYARYRYRTPYYGNFGQVFY